MGSIKRHVHVHVRTCVLVTFDLTEKFWRENWHSKRAKFTWLKLRRWRNFSERAYLCRLNLLTGMRGKKKCILECLFSDSHLLLALIHTHMLCRQVDIGITVLLNIATTPVYKKVFLFINDQQKLKLCTYLHTGVVSSSNR